MPLTRVSALCVAVVVCCAEAWGTAIPKYQMRPAAIKVDAQGVRSPLTVGRSFGVPVRVGTALYPPGQQVGTTYYDYQHNGSTGRQVDMTGKYIQMSWMKAPGPTELIRTVNWFRISVIGSPFDFTLDNGDVVWYLQLSGSIGMSQPFSAVRPGYTNMRNRPGGQAVVIYHDAPAVGGVQYWQARLDLQPGLGIWIDPPSTAPQPPGYLENAVIWPKSAISVCGTDTIHHAVGTWSGAANECWYWRGVIDGTNGTITWDAGQPTLIDPQDAFITSVIEAQGDTVYIALAKQISAVNRDLVYYRSVDCGVTWDPMVNVTGFADADPEGLYNELNAVIDEAGELHVIYNTVPADGRAYPTNLYQWSPSTGTRLITSAGWRNSCAGGTIPKDAWSCGGNGAGGNNVAIAEMSLAVKPAGLHGIADELLFAIWNQFGPTDSDCATVDELGTPGGCVNGEIYWSVSSDDGISWDRPQNISGSETPDCDPGYCFSEGWVSAAARADSGVYLSFVLDTHAGPAVLGQGVWSEGAYRILAPETRVPVVEPVIAVTPLEYYELQADPITGAPDSVNLSVRSVGTGFLSYTIEVTAYNNGPAHVLVNGGTSHTGSIAAGGSENVVISYHTSGLPDPSEQYWRLEVTSNDPENDPGQGGAPIEVTLQVFAASDWHACAEDTLSTGLHRMQVSSCLEMGNSGAPGTGFYNYADSSDWLVSGSPVVTRVTTGGDTVAYHNIFMTTADRTRALNNSFRAQSEFHVARDEIVVVGDSTYAADRAWGQASTTDTTIGIDYEIVFPKSPGPACGAYWKFNMTSLTGAPITGVTYGAVADVDLESSPYENAGDGYDGLAWIGGRGGSTDSLGNFLPSASWFALFYLPPEDSCLRARAVAGQVLSNANYVHPEQGFNTDSLFSLFTLFGSVGSWGTNIHIDTGQLYDDVSIMLINGHNKTLDPVTVVQWGYGIAVSDLSTADLESTIKGLLFMAEASCQLLCPVIWTGDVNISGNITSADIIYLVNFVFKSGDEPLPCEASGDVNCSGTVTSADIIYLVNFVFKGGLAPCDVCACIEDGVWACP